MASKNTQLITKADSKQQLTNQQDNPSTLSKRVKKSAKKSAAYPQSSKNQKRITNYFPMKFCAHMTQSSNNPQQVKINQLQKELKKKTEQVTQIQNQKLTIQNKYHKLCFENKQTKATLKQNIIDLLSQQAFRLRQKRQKIDLRLGYFINNMEKYVQGQDMTKLRKEIKIIAEELQNFQQQLKKCKSQEQKDRIKFAILYLNKQIINIKNLFRKKQVEVNVYKIKLRLAEKEKTCSFAQSNWPIVNDSKGNQRYLPLMLLGKGGFGQVYKCYDLFTNQHVAIKINIIQNKWEEDHSNAQNILKHVQRQIQIHQALKHPNITQIIQVLEISNNKVVFVLQYCDGPQLSLYIKERKCIQQKDAKAILYQIFSALSYLSQLKEKVIHYDLKPSNIMFHKGIVKLLDFGLCKEMDSGQSRMQLTSQGTGTYWYLPPQTFSPNYTMISPKVDVWSAGVIFFEMLYGRRPFADGKDQSEIFKQGLIRKQAKNGLPFPVQTPNGYAVSEKAKLFIQQCLRFNQQQRLSPQQALAHEYFKS